MIRKRSTRAAMSLLFLATVLDGKAAEAPTPFDPDLLRLAEIMGAISHLDHLCGNAEAPLWQSRMQRLIEAQKMTAEDRRRYIDSFNRGFRAFSALHRSCTAQSGFVLKRYWEEGAALTARVQERFGVSAGP